MSLISIIIPVYNVEHYLRHCLDSVVQQRLDDYEAIVVDDGSTDDSPKICDDYAAKYSQFRVIHQTNQGLSAARNKGMEMASGKYLLFLDSDDFLVPESLAPVLLAAETNNLDMLGYGFIDVADDSDDSPATQTISPVQIDVFKGLEFIARHKYVAMVWWYIVLRELVIGNEIQFPVGHMIEDAAFNVRLLSKVQRMGQIPNKVYCYRHRHGSIMRNRDKTHQRQLLGDYLYASSDVGLVLKDIRGRMSEKCYNRIRSHRDSYVFFGAIRAFKLGLANEFISEARSQGLYPFERMSKTDYPGFVNSFLYWCISRPRLWNLLSHLYRLFK